METPFSVASGAGESGLPAVDLSSLEQSQENPRDVNDS